jgi:hypothetical protein
MDRLRLVSILLALAVTEGTIVWASGTINTRGSRKGHALPPGVDPGRVLIGQLRRRLIE